jgi:hypothetical protein
VGDPLIPKHLRLESTSCNMSLPATSAATRPETSKYCEHHITAPDTTIRMLVDSGTKTRFESQGESILTPTCAIALYPGRTRLGCVHHVRNPSPSPILSCHKHATGVIATNAGNFATGTPGQDVNTTAVYGAYVGVGQSINFSNGDPCDLRGPFKTIGFDIGLGIISGSVTLSLGDNGVYQISVGNPFASKGLGLAMRANTTNTAVAPCNDCQ